MNRFEQIKALIELKEKGAISEEEFNKMLNLIKGSKDSHVSKSQKIEPRQLINTVETKLKQDVSALKEKELVDQVNIAFQQKDWKTLREKFEKITNKSLISLEVSTALFAYERRKSWLEKEEKAKKIKTQISSDAKKKKSLLFAGSLIVILIIGIGLYFFKSTGTKTSIEQSKVISNKNADQVNGTQIEKKQLIQLKATDNKEIKNIERNKHNKKEIEKNSSQSTAEQEKEVIEENQSQGEYDDGMKVTHKVFPEVLLIEAETLKSKIQDPTITNYDKIIAASRIKIICREYNSGINVKWKSDIQAAIRLNRCYIIAEEFF